MEPAEQMIESGGLRVMRGMGKLALRCRTSTDVVRCFLAGGFEGVDVLSVLTGSEVATRFILILSEASRDIGDDGNDGEVVVGNYLPKGTNADGSSTMFILKSISYVLLSLIVCT